MERPNEDNTDMRLSMISSFDNIVVVHVGLACELSEPNPIFKNQRNCSCDVVRGLICRNYNIFVVNIATLGSLKTDVAFVFFCALTQSEKVSTSYFSRFVYFLA